MPTVLNFYLSRKLQKLKTVLDNFLHFQRMVSQLFCSRGKKTCKNSSVEVLSFIFLFRFLPIKELSVKTVLLIDSAPSHLPESNLKYDNTLQKVDSIPEAFWNRVGKETLSNCWKKCSNQVNDDNSEQNITLSFLKQKWQSKSRSLKNATNSLDLVHSGNIYCCKHRD